MVINSSGNSSQTLFWRFPAVISVYRNARNARAIQISQTISFTGILRIVHKAQDAAIIHTGTAVL